MIEEILQGLTANQKKLVIALLENPSGLISRDLASITGVSNKSATLTPDIRELLKERGLELVIAKEHKGARWMLKEIQEDRCLSGDVERALVLLNQLMEHNEACNELALEIQRLLK